MGDCQVYTVRLRSLRFGRLRSDDHLQLGEGPPVLVDPPLLLQHDVLVLVLSLLCKWEGRVVRIYFKCPHRSINLLQWGAQGNSRSTW